MFCPKCGKEQNNGALFCGYCGNPINSATPSIDDKPLNKKEYLLKKCTKKAKNRQLAIKIMGIVSLTVQTLLFLLSVIYIWGAIMAIINITNYSGDAPTYIILIPAFFLIGSYLFTILGIRKKSTGNLITSIFMAFFATVFTYFKEGVAIAIILVLIHLIMVILNCLNTNEYENYLKSKS